MSGVHHNSVFFSFLFLLINQTLEMKISFSSLPFLFSPPRVFRSTITELVICCRTCVKMRMNLTLVNVIFHLKYRDLPKSSGLDYMILS